MVLLTPDLVALELGISVGQVFEAIRRELIVAYPVPVPGYSFHTYRVCPEDLIDFVAAGSPGLDGILNPPAEPVDPEPATASPATDLA